MEQKRILITGVSRGIGRALVNDLLSRGHIIYGISRSEESLARIASEVSGEFHGIYMDISKDDVSTIHKHLDTDVLDIVINNAGYLVNRPFEEIASTDLVDVYRANVFAPFHLLQVLIPLLKNSPMGHVVNVGSMGGVNGSAKFPGLSAYSSSKGALSILTECLAEEFKETNIHFNCLALGSANTEMLAEAFPGYESPVSAESMASYIARFSLEQWAFYNGKTLPVSSTTP